MIFIAVWKYVRSSSSEVKSNKATPWVVFFPQNVAKVNVRSYYPDMKAYWINCDDKKQSSDDKMGLLS